MNLILKININKRGRIAFFFDLLFHETGFTGTTCFRLLTVSVLSTVKSIKKQLATLISVTLYTSFFEEQDGFLPKNEWISMNGPHVVLIRGQNFWAH